MTGYPCVECGRNVPDPTAECPHCAFTPSPVSSGGSLEGEAAKRAAEKAREALAEARKKNPRKHG